MDIQGFEKIFGEAQWPEEPFETHAFIADVQRVSDRFMLMLELLSSDGESISPALLFADRDNDQAVLGNKEPERLEGQWRTFQLVRGLRNASSLSILASLADPEGVVYGIQSVKPTPEAVISAHAIPAGETASEQEIMIFLSNAVPDLNMRLGVIDVGQGAAACLYPAGDCLCVMPTLYLDIGGGSGYNAKTFPAGGVQWCFTMKPGILLSHWHWDHWAGATYGSAANIAGPLTATWLVPSTPPGPLGKKLAAAISAAGGKVIHWPAGTLPISAHKLLVGEATGTGWNNSGLVLLAELELGRFSLVPGDAAYTFLPEKLQLSHLKTLLISHHGGNLDANPPAALPLPDGGPNCHAYCSVGYMNTYGHPTIIASYAAAGWHVVRTDARLIHTPAIHYDAETGGLMGGIISPCCLGHKCSLGLST